MAGGLEGADLGGVWLEGSGEWLLRGVVEVFAYVEGSVFVRLGLDKIFV